MRVYVPIISVRSGVKQDEKKKGFVCLSSDCLIKTDCKTQ